jgi:hypothetical protein
MSQNTSNNSSEDLIQYINTDEYKTLKKQFPLNPDISSENGQDEHDSKE